MDIYAMFIDRLKKKVTVLNGLIVPKVFVVEQAYKVFLKLICINKGLRTAKIFMKKSMEAEEEEKEEKKMSY